MIFYFDGAPSPKELANAFQAIVSFLQENAVTRVDSLHMEGLVWNVDGLLQVQQDMQIRHVEVEQGATGLWSARAVGKVAPLPR